MKQLLAAAAGAIAFGVLAGYVDLHNDEVQPAMACLLMGGVLAGALAPRWTWGLALGVIAGAGVPIAHTYARLSGFQLPYTVSPPQAPWLAIAPAVIAAAIGIAIRRGVLPARQPGRQAAPPTAP